MLKIFWKVARFRAEAAVWHFLQEKPLILELI